MRTFKIRVLCILLLIFCFSSSPIFSREYPQESSHNMPGKHHNQQKKRHIKPPPLAEYRELRSFLFSYDPSNASVLPADIIERGTVNRIELTENNEKLVLHHIPDPLDVPLNYMVFMPLILPGSQGELWNIKVDGAVSGDRFQVLGQSLCLQTVSVIPHTVTVIVSRKTQKASFSLDISGKHKRNTPFFGTQDHFLRFPPGPTVKALNDMKIMQQLPVQMYRLPLAWPMIERRRGQENWQINEWYVDAVRESGQLKVQGGLGRLPKWIGKTEDLLNDKSLLNEYRQHIRKTLDHFTDKVDFWAMGNEPLVFWWKNYLGKPPEKYVRERGEVLLLIIKEASLAIRSKDPKALVLSPAFVNGCRKPKIEINGRKKTSISYFMLKWLLENGMAKYVDVINVHNYPTFGKNKGHLQPMTEQNLESWRDFDRAADNTELLDLLDKYSINKAIWTTEYDAGRLGKNPSADVFRRQALALLRVTAILAHQRGEGLFFFELFDYSHQNDLQDSYLVRNVSGETLPAFTAFQDAIRMLTGATPFFANRFRGAKEKGDNYSGLVYKMFTRPDEDIVFFWNNSSKVKKMHMKLDKPLLPEHIILAEQILYKPEGNLRNEHILQKRQFKGAGPTIDIFPYEVLLFRIVSDRSGFKWLESIEEL